jgi:hypothetical protein
MKDLFAGFSDATKAQRFEKRAQQMGSIWCCVQPASGPGHIWYDFWWDKVPHTDRHNRQYTEPWFPRLGP